MAFKLSFQMTSVSTADKEARTSSNRLEQFLNSVLSTITDSSARIVPPPVRPATSTSESQNDSATCKSSTSSSERTFPMAANSLSNGKRKAERELHGPRDKIRKESNSSKASPSISVAAKPTINGKPKSTAEIEQLSVPYRGTSRPSPATSLVTESKPTLKKGSFAEIMARQKAATTPIGIITHKPKEKLSSKKELELQKQAMKAKKAGTGKMPRSAPTSNRSSPAPQKKGVESPSKTATAKPVAYQGTAKPKAQPAYKGTMKPLPSCTSKQKTISTASDVTRRRSISDLRRRSEDDESGDEEEDSYVSEEDYSDMEAGFEDVEEEDEKAARIAKKEDEYEKMMLDELARQKEAKKKRLAAMAEKARRR